MRIRAAFPLRAWLLVAVLASTCARADVLERVQQLRIRGCAQSTAQTPPLRHSTLLDAAAERWARRATLATAVERSGYDADAIAALHLVGSNSSLQHVLGRSSCKTLMRHELRDMGAYRDGTETWIVLAAPYRTPPRTQGPWIAARALELVNAARARGARCGQRRYGPAPPLRRSAVLDRVARGHASDMAMHHYFEHEDLAGRSPADRVRAAGYRERLVGENIAYGPTSAEEVVQGWLDSPGHCENLMTPRFTEMGIALAPGQDDQPGLYWVQLLAAPNA